MQEKYLEAIAVQETRTSALAPIVVPIHNCWITSSLKSSVELVLSRVVAAVAMRFTPLKTVSQIVVHGIVKGMNHATHNSFDHPLYCGTAPMLSRDDIEIRCFEDCFRNTAPATAAASAASL